MVRLRGKWIPLIASYFGPARFTPIDARPGDDSSWYVYFVVFGASAVLDQRSVLEPSQVSAPRYGLDRFNYQLKELYLWGGKGHWHRV